MNLDDVIKKINGTPKLDHKESSDGLWEVNENDLFNFLKENVSTGFPYPMFTVPVGGYFYLYFVTSSYKLPICVRSVGSDSFLTSLNSIYSMVVSQDASI